MDSFSQHVVCMEGLKEFKKRCKNEKLAVTEFPSAKWGHPLLLGSELDARVEHF